PQQVGAASRPIAVGVSEELLDVTRPDQAALATRRRLEGLLDEVEDGTVDGAQCRDGEVALRPVDHLVRQDSASGSFEDSLAVLVELESRGATGGEFDELVVEKRDPRFEAPRHRHVVDTLDRIVWHETTDVEAL